MPAEAGGWARPILDMTIGDMDDVLVPCLVDSGAVHTLLPRWVAEAAAIELDGAPTAVLGVAAGATTAAFTTVRLSTGELVWEADVGFCDPWPYGWGLLGQSSFFRFFTVTFRAANLELQIDPIDS